MSEIQLWWGYGIGVILTFVAMQFMNVLSTRNLISWFNTFDGEPQIPFVMAAIWPVAVGVCAIIAVFMGVYCGTNWCCNMMVNILTPAPAPAEPDIWDGVTEEEKCDAYHSLDE